LQACPPAVSTFAIMLTLLCFSLFSLLDHKLVLINLISNCLTADAEIIILHEMGHVLGLVSVFTGSACRVTCTTTSTSTYTCPKAAAEYSALGLSSSTLLVDRNKCRGHWDEDAFPKSTGSSELMTPFVESGLAQPLTRVSIAAIEESTTDYVVDYSTANSFPYTGSTAADKAFKALVPDSTFTIDMKKLQMIQWLIPREKPRADVDWSVVCCNNYQRRRQ
jgi:hypothetical protein